MLERRQEDKLPALRDTPKKKLLEETAKVDKALQRLELFYAGAVVVQLGWE